MNIVFVILHYLASVDTIECVESILNNIKYKNKYIIIVDNNSTNNSYNDITKKYKNKKQIILIKNDLNLGYAKGFNLGFLYAKSNLNPNFIIFLNNDTVIYQKKFCDILIKKYNKYNFSVLGPDIYTLDNYHLNPYKRKKWNIIKLLIFKLKTYLKIIDLYSLKIFYRLSLYNKKNRFLSNKLIGDYLNVCLHGSCLIFSKNYINKYNGLDDRTFLYMEEDLLKINMDYHNELMMYTSDLKILHKESIATKLKYPNKISREIVKLKNILKSTNICIKKLKEIRNEK